MVDFNYSWYREEREGERGGDACAHRENGLQVENAQTHNCAHRYTQTEICIFVGVVVVVIVIVTHLLSTPPSREALRHSGGERRLCTSATVTLYFDVELRSDSRPGTEQNTSLGFTTPPKRPSLFTGMAEMLLFLDKETGPGGVEEEETRRGGIRVGRVGGEGRGRRQRERRCPVNFMQFGVL